MQPQYTQDTATSKVDGASQKVPHTRGHPCPICTGHRDLPQGDGRRCWGFTAGTWVHCTRPEWAGGLPLNERSGGYVHRMVGDCRCGVRHDPRPPLAGGPGRRIVGTYPYRDAAGTVRYEVVRYLPKAFKQRRPDGAGGWIWHLDDTERVLFRLPELLGADPNEPVLITEGEKHAERLAALGFVSTTNVGGKGKWRAAYSACLAGRDCVLLPDNDPDGGGQRHMEQVARSLDGVAGGIWVLELPGLPPKGDVIDWLDQGHSASELRRLISDARRWTAQESGGPAGAPPPQEETQGTPCAEGFTYISLAELLDRPTPAHRFVVDDLLLMGGSSLLVAKPKVGKTVLALQAARDVASGAVFLGRATVAGAVLYLAFEEADDELALTMRRAGSNRDWPISFHIGAQTPRARLEALRADITRYGPRLVVIDTLAFWMQQEDFDDYGQVGRAMRPLHALARETGTHIMAVHHAGKSREGIDAALGSTALAANVDTIAVETETERGERLLETKQRYGPSLPRTLLRFDQQTGCITLGEGQAAQRQRTFEEDVLASVAAGHRTQSAMEAHLHCNRNHLGRSLGHLVADNLLSCTGSGKAGDPFLYDLTNG